ncbi:UPF0496 protein 1 [Canna indica]|uniref:UPF0496 protein 1 n=1 Tax=Canna indica TaxID=4628 RepID=A0AAQ3L5J9_9LILI|nr:UPF0496 protein 1 [Canna indica]
MGGQQSKRSGTRTAVNPGGAGAGHKGFQYTAELSSYEAACRLDPELRSFDAALQQRTSHAISMLAIGVELRTLSFATLREVTGSLLETNKEVVHFLLQCKQDIWKNPELFSLVEDYFECSLRTLDFCTELEKCLKKARDAQLIIQFALKQFEEKNDDEAASTEHSKNKCARTLEKLRQFKAAGNPFTEDFSQVFDSVYRQHQSMLEKLLQRKKKLDRKLKKVKAWRKVSSAIFIAALAAVVVCSVVAAAVAAPPIAAAMAAAAAVPVGSAGKWIDSLVRKYQVALEGERELVTSMEFGTRVALGDLENIEVMVDRLGDHLDSLLGDAEFAMSKGEEGVEVAVEEIRRKMEVLMKSIEELGKQVDVCSRDIRKARTLVLERIIKHPS